MIFCQIVHEVNDSYMLEIETIKQRRSEDHSHLEANLPLSLEQELTKLVEQRTRDFAELYSQRLRRLVGVSDEDFQVDEHRNEVVHLPGFSVAKIDKRGKGKKKAPIRRKKQRKRKGKGSVDSSSGKNMIDGRQMPKLIRPRQLHVTPDMLAASYYSRRADHYYDPFVAAQADAVAETYVQDLRVMPIVLKPTPLTVQVDSKPSSFYSRDRDYFAGKSTNDDNDFSADPTTQPIISAVKPPPLSLGDRNQASSFYGRNADYYFKGERVDIEEEEGEIVPMIAASRPQSLSLSSEDCRPSFYGRQNKYYFETGMDDDVGDADDTITPVLLKSKPPSLNVQSLHGLRSSFYSRSPQYYFKQGREMAAVEDGKECAIQTLTAANRPPPLPLSSFERQGSYYSRDRGFYEGRVNVDSDWDDRIESMIVAKRPPPLPLDGASTAGSFYGRDSQYYFVDGQDQPMHVSGPIRPIISASCPPPLLLTAADKTTSFYNRSSSYYFENGELIGLKDPADGSMRIMELMADTC